MARLDKAAPDTLSLDLSNPRMPDEKFADEDEAIAYLYVQADLSELIQSIGNSGWLDFEPLIVEEPTRTVVEGNRRLAALRIIASLAFSSSSRSPFRSLYTPTPHRPKSK